VTFDILRRGIFWSQNVWAYFISMMYDHDESWIRKPRLLFHFADTDFPRPLSYKFMLEYRLILRMSWQLKSYIP